MVRSGALLNAVGINSLAAATGSVRLAHRLEVARKILPRDLRTAMHDQIWMTNPDQVKQWLALNLAQREYEIFLVLLLDAHNHPSLLAEPSRTNELLTRSLRDALALVDVRLLDHLVVGGTNVVSLAERGQL